MSGKITKSVYVLFIIVLCATFSVCSRSGKLQQRAFVLPQPAAGPPDPRPPQPAEIQEAIKRVYGQTVTVESGRAQYFITGDLNGDGAPDLAVVVKPATGMLAELNHELANWLRGDPRKVELPDPKMQTAHARRFPPAPEPVIIEQTDVLLAIIHGYGPTGWRNSQARQSYLLKNAAGKGLKLQPLDEARKMTRNESQPPQLLGDVVRQELDKEQGLLYYTGAKYAWHRFNRPLF